MSKPLKAFITYSHKDLEQNIELQTRLAVLADQGKIELWDDNKILPGDEWEEDITENLAESDILLYLTSAASLASKNCNKELAEALNSKIRVIPIILEHCDWENHQLSRFEVLPHKGKPINKWQPESDGWQNVVTGIRKVVDEMRPQLDSSSGTPNDHLRAELAFQQGNVFMMFGGIDKAIDAYSNAIKLNPRDTDAFNNRGVAYQKLGKFDSAIDDYNTAIPLNPYDAVIYSNRGAAYVDKGEPDRGLEDINRAIELNPNYAETFYNRGIAYVNKGEYDRAIADYNIAVKRGRDHADVYNNRGIAFHKKCEFDRAILDFDTAIKMSPKFPDHYVNRGNAFHEKGAIDHAIEDFNRAIELNPNGTIAYNSRGNVYSGKGEYDRAIADFNKAIQLNPNLAEPYNNRGGVYHDKEDFDRAIKDFDKAIQLNPGYANAYYNRGVTYKSKGNVQFALKDFNKAIELNPDFAIAYSNRGVVYDMKVDHDRAMLELNKAIELNPNLAEAYINRGIAYDQRSDFNRATEDFNMAIQLKPKFAEAYNSRGITYGKKDQVNLALKDFNHAIEIKTDYAIAYNNRGAVYRGKGDFDLAIVDCNRAIELKPDYAEPYSNRGAAYRNKGDYVRAIADFDTAIQLEPNLVEAYNGRGNAYITIGEYDRAIVDFNKVIELNPGLSIVYNNRGVAYYSKGEVDRALEDYNKAIDLKPVFVAAYYNRGEAWLRLKEWENARKDLNTAKDNGVDIIAGLRNDYKSVKDFEKRHRVNLPADIAAILTRPRRTRFPRKEKFIDSDGTPFESPEVLNLLAKLRNAGTPLSDYIQTRPSFGIKTGSNGAFVVDSATRDRLIAEHPSSVEILKPFLHGRDIRRWRVAKPDTWLIFTYRRIDINRYPAIRNHLETHRSTLSKRTGKQKWYELPAAKSDAERFTQTKLICPNSYDHQTFAVDSDGFYCGDTCYLIPTEETWLCGLLNSRVVEWFYSQTSNQLTGDYLRARSRYMQQIPIPDLTPTQKSLTGKIVDYLTYLQGQPTTSGGDLAHSRDFIMLGYFERIIDGLTYESYLSEELHQGEKQFFKPLLDEGLPQIEEIQGDKMPALREIFERLYERTHQIRINLFFLDSVKPIRIIEDKA
ncbi:MAG: tetratricopeptide repeat protein [Candidatus Poribacteria bacterium]|nr:tetratricopeptide repeat protein [Candidatus Poribacteria bacterium]